MSSCKLEFWGIEVKCSIWYHFLQNPFIWEIVSRSMWTNNESLVTETIGREILQTNGSGASAGIPPCALSGIPSECGSRPHRLAPSYFARWFLPPVIVGSCVTVETSGATFLSWLIDAHKPMSRCNCPGGTPLLVSGGRRAPALGSIWRVGVNGSLGCLCLWWLTEKWKGLFFTALHVFHDIRSPLTVGECGNKECEVLNHFSEQAREHF